MLKIPNLFQDAYKNACDKGYVLIAFLGGVGLFVFFFMLIMSFLTFHMNWGIGRVLFVGFAFAVLPVFVYLAEGGKNER
ncbi:hypothetical protein CCAL6883_08320 [Campylobacter sp. RM6883]|uniref:hypothetical protein n=1 Tax=Campylobacter californiensis TaxID=1032243 RepID=UPI0014518D3D|nr:hypothetical protein [Campylobacter sp. RM6914]MBE2985340.1 hypothetical protein [Campylobacter sp. RM6883]MBE2995873.1 hypothetical protein [Campylobacter sp. RM6913]QCD51237.1 putative membrane protein [Campylobacter sp. RM6914]